MDMTSIGNFVNFIGIYQSGKKMYDFDMVPYNVVFNLPMILDSGFVYFDLVMYLLECQKVIFLFVLLKIQMSIKTF